MLEEARRLGILGPGPVEAHLRHAAGFASAIDTAMTADGGSGSRGADLGSGAGLPGLPLALRYSGWRWTLVDSAARRAAFLREAVRVLGVDGRVEVAEERAEMLGRVPEHRGRYDLVVARSFGPPAVVAECAAPLLVCGGLVVVSEPPRGDPARWPADGLALLGMTPVLSVLAEAGAYQLLRQEHPCADRYPRRVGVPTKRPLF